MARYIDADVLMKELEREVELADDWKTAHEIVNVVKYAPTVDVEPVKHGEWMGAEYDGYADGNPVYYSWMCSVCHAEVESEGEPPEFRYCPNCGARMEEE